MKILVIDDKSKTESYPRKELLDVLEQREKVISDIIEPDPEELKNKLTKSETGEYELIVVDYMLEKTRTIFKTGTALYSLIRAYAESTPIYLISVKTAPTNQIGDFDLFINDDAINNHAAFKADIESHISLKSCNKLETFLKLIECPEEVAEEIEAMIKPILSKRDFESQSDETQIPEKEIVDSLNLRLFRWLARSLLRKEGPLVSSAGAAALLGVSTDYFENISGQFNNALYRGVFNQSFKKRWWITLLEDEIYEKEDPENYLETFPFKEAASKLLGATDEHNFSICAVCEKRYPDGLGIITDQGNELHPVHISCSKFNDTLLQEPFFRNPRIIEVE
ncbi:hypothetical protein [Vibrio rhizosphaerae]|uniref:hypothetical protein n=1 Tax=Vibrio rhizosphaerae TaxID=398736 RepID=UPI0005703830|nr:hypothetical protein [Vibrio rhizosphaerae]